jgi:hypothetical protein
MAEYFVIYSSGNQGPGKNYDLERNIPKIEVTLSRFGKVRARVLDTVWWIKSNEKPRRICEEMRNFITPAREKVLVVEARNADGVNLLIDARKLYLKFSEIFD